MATDPTDQPRHARGWPPEEEATLLKAEEALRAGGPRGALQFLTRSKAAGPWATNARAVFLMRLGEHRLALDALRGLVLGVGSSLRHDAPAVFKANYATALLLDGNMTGCVVALGQARDEGHPAVRRLREAIRRWESTLTLWQRVILFMGGMVAQPFELGYPPGEL
jgi:hypothetical protein